MEPLNAHCIIIQAVVACSGFNYYVTGYFTYMVSLLLYCIFLAPDYADVAVYAPTSYYNVNLPFKKNHINSLH